MIPWSSPPARAMRSASHRLTVRNDRDLTKARAALASLGRPRPNRARVRTTDASDRRAFESDRVSSNFRAVSYWPTRTSDAARATVSPRTIFGTPSSNKMAGINTCFKRAPAELIRSQTPLIAWAETTNLGPTTCGKAHGRRFWIHRQPQAQIALVACDVNRPMAGPLV